MKNQSVSDFVAATMNEVLNSKEHKSIFGTQYEFAQDLNDAKKHKEEDKDSCMSDDNEAKKKKEKESSDQSSADDNDAKKSQKCPDCGKSMNLCECDKNDAADQDLEPSVAYDVAIDSLLTASAALDSVGLGKGSAVTLKIASFVVEAKKKDKKEKDSKKSKKSDKKDSKKDSKKDDKKSSSSSSKK